MCRPAVGQQHIYALCNNLFQRQLLCWQRQLLLLLRTASVKRFLCPTRKFCWISLTVYKTTTPIVILMMFTRTQPNKHLFHQPLGELHISQQQPLEELHISRQQPLGELHISRQQPLGELHISQQQPLEELHISRQQPLGEFST